MRHEIDKAFHVDNGVTPRVCMRLIFIASIDYEIPRVMMANIAGLATLYMYMHNIMVHVYPCRNEGGRPNRRLFCYIDSDHFQVPVEEVGGYRRQCSMNHLVHKKCFHWLNEYMYFLYIFSRFTWCAFLKLSCAFIPLSFLICRLVSLWWLEGRS